MAPSRMSAEAEKTKEQKDRSPDAGQQAGGAPPRQGGGFKTPPLDGAWFVAES